MDCVLTLIANPAKPCLDRSVQTEAIRLIREQNDNQPVETEQLAEGVAVDFYFHSKTGPAFCQKLTHTLATALAPQPLDVVCQPRAGRAKSLLLADMDSTIIEQECLDELADLAGLGPEIAAITARAMHGELDFTAALKTRVALLKGLPATLLQETLDARLSLTPGAIELVQTMNSRNGTTALISGGFTFFTHRIAQAVGFHENQGNVLELAGGLLSGTVAEPILGKAAKAEALQALCLFSGLDPEEAIAVGDGANDLEMLQAAGTGVAFRAKRAVAEQANCRIDHGDLTALLYLQGIKRKDFTAPC